MKEIKVDNKKPNLSRMVGVTILGIGYLGSKAEEEGVIIATQEADLYIYLKDGKLEVKLQDA